MGQNSKYPHGAIAFKFDDQEEETTLLDIEWTMGRTGVLTPVAVFDEVELDGTSVERASLHNISHMEKVNIGGKGSNVKVVKSNQIIPQIVEVIEKKGEFTVPTKCPYCKEDTEIKMDNSSKILICSNEDCCEKLVMNLVHYVSRPCMNIKGLSEQLLRTFVNHGLVASAIDLYSLYKYEDYLSSIDGLGKKSVKAIIKNIEKSKNVNLSKFINSLGIQMIGITTSKEISLNVKNIKSFLSMSFEDWVDIIGEAKAKSLTNYLSKNMLYISLLMDKLFIEDERLEQTS